MASGHRQVSSVKADSLVEGLSGQQKWLGPCVSNGISGHWWGVMAGVWAALRMLGLGCCTCRVSANYTPR